jgi:hypothetical protein
VDPIGLILDLVLNGRNPINPVPAFNCSAILYETFNWVGFKVEAGPGLAAAVNYFEFGVGNDNIPMIKRVSYGPQIVATDFDGLFPVNPPGPNKIELSTTNFLIRRVDGSQPATIGELALTYNPLTNPKTVKICKVGNWSPGYTFTMVTAQLANGMNSHLTIDRTERNFPPRERLIVENPISNVLNIFNPTNQPEKAMGSISIFDMNSKIVFMQHLDLMPNHLSLPVDELQSGVYILRIEIANNVYTQKLIKL